MADAFGVSDLTESTYEDAGVLAHIDKNVVNQNVIVDDFKKSTFR
jgi:hypothetical protein